jgi:A/G-specific adenine glycosylase
VCLPGEPLCKQCPVARWCATRGPLPVSRAQARKKARVGYRLAQRDGSVLLVRRPATESLMPEMWELPRAAAANGNALFRLRHSITVTDYEVTVVPGAPARVPSNSRWVRQAGLERLPLTGLARKILRRAQLL